MRLLKVCVLVVFAAVLVSPLALTRSVEGQAATEAPADYDTFNSNGFTDNTTFTADKDVFEEVEDTAAGLGPTYNAQSCRECHQNPISGGISQITELRVGHEDANGNFVNPTIFINDGANSIPNRSLVNDRAICPGIVTDKNGVQHNFLQTNIQERVPGAENIRTFRTTTNALGDGFVECIDSNNLVAIGNNERNQSGGRINPLIIQVPVLEAPGQVRVGRFGWKDQMASLLSFSSDAYLNEMGISNPLNPTDFTTVCKVTTDPEDQAGSDGLADIDKFARFMRATKAPSRDNALAATADAQAGQQIFNSIGCAICHVTSITTAPAGTRINGGAFTVPAALGNKIIHPFGDFLLHNVGTGDDIVQNGGQASADFMRTPPLWGVRTRDRLMHDGESLTRNDAILRHAGEATFVINNYQGLSTTQKNQLITFINSL
ncbi:MAG TPA: di-heme oxidoredictase family protein [Blastocatellia bacterium]|nr:di-heme oxidoredictase family protein [Blastocatellia bacterium]